VTPIRSIRRPIGAALALAVLAPSAFPCESCRAAVATSRTGLAQGLNDSVLFMIGMVFATLVSFLLLVRASYRTEARRVAAGAGYAPEGKIRWGSGE
jgi:hypothetical protein